MTHLPKTELVGVLSPSAINSRDIGGNLGLVNSGWVDLGDITGVASRIDSVCSLGNGISLSGTGNDHILRSVDYGNIWIDIGITTVAPIWKIVYLGNGIVLAGLVNGHVLRSTDFGLNWIDVGIGAAAVFSVQMSYLGSGVVILGTDFGHVWRSTNFGLTWADLGDITGAGKAIEAISYLENGIALAGISTGHIFRSTDFGATWPTDLAISASDILTISYLGNGIVIAGTASAGGDIWRSVDFGLNWTELAGVLSLSSVNISLYLGNGIVIAGQNSGDIWKSLNYGLSWVNLFTVPGGDVAVASCYLGNGVSILGTDLGHIWRNDVSYKLDECVSFYTPDYSYYRRTGGTNYYSGMIVGLTTIVNIGANADYVFAIPIIISKNTTFDRIAVDVTTACSGVCVTAGANCRLGIYRDTGNVYPGSLIIDAGAVAIDVLGLAELIINQPLTAGLYWLFMSYHTPAVCLTPPQFRGANFLPMLGCYNGANVFQYPLEGYFVSGLDYTAGLPVTAPGRLNRITSVFPSPIVALRAT